MEEIKKAVELLIKNEKEKNKDIKKLVEKLKENKNAKEKKKRMDKIY